MEMELAQFLTKARVKLVTPIIINISFALTIVPPNKWHISYQNIGNKWVHSTVRAHKTLRMDTLLQNRVTMGEWQSIFDKLCM